MKQRAFDFAKQYADYAGGKIKIEGFRLEKEVTTSTFETI